MQGVRNLYATALFKMQNKSFDQRDNSITV